ncbi:MAG: ligase-associated DNA damage response DEXH box helicase [Wenzhouxiangellaceae bacterium]
MSRPSLIEDWFAQREWQALAFQRQTWQAMGAGGSGVIRAATGCGKTWAAFGGVLSDLEQQQAGQGLRWLWICPLRALAADTAQRLQHCLTDLGRDWQVGVLTGDTRYAQRQRWRQQPPTILVTTPESLALRLSHRDACTQFADLSGVVVDEWHDLASSKRSIHLQLCLARLSAWLPLQRWALVGPRADALALGQQLLPTGATPLVIDGPLQRRLQWRTLTPDRDQPFPWCGHLGLKQLPAVIEQIRAAGTSLLFTNTRGQAEAWYQALQAVAADLGPQLAIHHGSLDQSLRRQVEAGIRAGDLRCVVATSSIDAGVDFPAVDQVIHIGSPRSLARLLQRAGRSGRGPLAQCELYCVATHGVELLELAALRRELEVLPGKADKSVPQDEHSTAASTPLALDVLAQFLVTLAVGEGFASEQALQWVRGAWHYRQLSARDWNWLLQFITQGGAVLEHYPQFQRVEVDDGRYRVTRKRTALWHRLAIGTISSDSQMQVRQLRGGVLGHIEERFIAALRPGERFIFAGRALELVRVREMTAYVRQAKGRSHGVARWLGSTIPWSAVVGDFMRAEIDAYRRGVATMPETQACATMLRIQSERSALPPARGLLIECYRLRDGHWWYCYPFAGRRVHEALAGLVALRLSDRGIVGMQTAVSDHGIEWHARKLPDPDMALWRQLLAPAQASADLARAVDIDELAKRQFRDIARIAGLVFEGYPGKRKMTRQVQASSGLLFDTLSQYANHHPLLNQARDEVRRQVLDQPALLNALEHIEASPLVIEHPRRLTPLALPLRLERQRLSGAEGAGDALLAEWLGQVEASDAA